MQFVKTMATDSGHNYADKEQLRQREIVAQIAALRAPVATTRAAAARRLGDMRAGLDPLLAALHDPNEYVRAAAAMALGGFSEDKRLPVIADDLLSAIDDPSERVCQAAIRSLGLLKARAAAPEIEDFLDDPNTHIAGATVLALARLAGPSAREQASVGKQLAAFLDHPSTYVRTQAVRALTLLQYQPAGSVLVQMLQSIRDERQAVQQRSEPAPDAPFDFRVDAHYALQNQLVHAVGELQLREAVPTLLEIAQKDIGLRGLAVEALVAIEADIPPELLTRLLHDPSAFLRRRLISLIAQTNYTPALPLLRELLTDESVTTRGAALQALAQMRDREALPEITWIAQYDSNPFLRVNALNSLIALQSSEALPLLLSLSSDSNFEIRRVIVDRLLEWNPPGDAILLPLARYLRDFPDDERSQRLKVVLESRGFDLSCLQDSGSPRPGDLPTTSSATTGSAAAGSSTAAISPTDGLLLPPEIQADAETLQDLLERWQRALLTPANNAAERSRIQRTAAALTYLIDLLKSGQEKQEH